MRIVIVCGAGYVSGKEKIMFSLLKGLRNNGMEVHCITSKWSDGQFEEMLSSGKISYSKTRLGFISKTFHWHAVKMTLEQVLYWPKLLYDYRRIISEFKPDVVIHSNFHHLFLVYPVIGSRNTVNIYHSHESITNTKFYQWLFKLFENKIKHFVSVSDYVTNKLKDLGIKNEKLTTIYNGLEIMNWKPREWSSDNIFRIGIAGQVGRWKGHEDLLLALDILRNKYRLLNFKLLIFGNGKVQFMDEMKELIDKGHLNEFVEWKGYVKEMSEIYSNLQVVCLPSRSEEPLATAALEAGLFGVPVIATRRGGFPEIIQDGYNGFLVHGNSPEEIAEILSILIQDPSQAFKTGVNHQNVVLTSFSFEAFINNWKNTLAGLLS